jgi:hypothetical protein
MAEIEKMIRSIRECPLLGRLGMIGTYTDEELTQELTKKKIQTVTEALRWAHQLEKQYLEQAVEKSFPSYCEVILAKYEEFKTRLQAYNYEDLE